MILRPYYGKLLALCSLAPIGMGLYFVLSRPALPPEDAR